MKRTTKRSILFIGKSLLWSFLLYAITMLTCNWDEVRSNISGTTGIAKSSTPASETPKTEVIEKNISEKPSLIKIGTTIINAVMGVNLVDKTH
jgi:hypothetical protein